MGLGNKCEHRKDGVFIGWIVRLSVLFGGAVFFAALLPGKPVHAACPGTIVNGEAQTVTQNLANGESCTVEAGGNIATTLDNEEGISGNDDNTINNSGNISTTGDFAEGIDVDDDNTIHNSGNISTTGERADGIYAREDNTIHNSGNISTTGDDAYGIYAREDNTIHNSGTISITGEDAIGIFAFDDNIIHNSGTISTTGDYATGIDIDNDNTIHNSGTISTTGDDSEGIDIDRDNIIHNSGTISTTGESAEGILAYGDNKIHNSGTISTTGDYANGIEIEDDNTIHNSGNISTTGSGADGIEAFVDNTIHNSGLISAANADAIDFSGGTNTLNLLPGSRIFGLVDLGSGQDTVNFLNGVSNVMAFDPVQGIPEVINANGRPVVVSGNTVATIDPTAFGQSDEMLVDLTSGVSGAVHARLGGGTGGGLSDLSGLASFGPNGDSQMGFGATMNLGAKDPTTSKARNRRSGGWVQAIAGHRSENADGVGGEVTHGYAGGVAGIDGWIKPNLQIGAFGGASNGDLEVELGSQSVDVNTFFGGVYANLTDGFNFLRLMLTAGQSDHSSKRLIANNLVAGGLETASASYSSEFFSPEASIGTTLHLGGIAIEPSARVRYAHMSLDGYTETGTANNMTVNDRDVSMWLGRAQVALPMESAVELFSPRIGVEVWNSDADEISGSLLGQTINFDANSDDGDVTGFLGALVSTNLGNGVSAFLDGEIHSSGDGVERSVASAGIRITF